MPHERCFSARALVNVTWECNPQTRARVAGGLEVLEGVSKRAAFLFPQPDTPWSTVVGAALMSGRVSDLCVEL
jgi:hypothetical protein